MTRQFPEELRHNMKTMVYKYLYPGRLSSVVLTALFSICFFIPNTSTAYDMDECISEMIKQASDLTTIGELRSQCEKRVTREVAADPPPLIAKRLSQDSDNVLQPFTLMAHKPNYALLGAYNFHGYDASVYQEQLDNPSFDLSDVEAQFQISVKFPLLINVFDTFDVYSAYTNHSFWQLYELDSSPFRETNHEPEVWLQFNPKWEFFGFTNSANLVGFVHQSNGQGGIISRSWNRIFANFLIERGGLALSFKNWFRISEDESEDDNPDITDYLGHFEIRAAYKWKEHVFSAMSRNNLESGFDKGAIELSWSFPLGDYPYLKGYVQYFNGYGESLIDYNNRVNKIGIGFALTDWL